MTEQSDRTDVPQETCPKRAYRSRRAARAAHKHAHWRVGIYQCEVCRLFHVRNEEKR